ncbi:uncharacterized protein SPSC_01099 [Sporisorium scitamineum]|uniref:WW domain-containing protein n=2 Tax=Sporisorium scitamineum TaxID=49012 RepID=A0A127Z8L0_9BASI|nr:uncharacterized protein SPSC_01099 [Sporisorium scitamineum]
MIHSHTSTPTLSEIPAEKTHTASSSVGSSVSFYTVTSSFGHSACGSSSATSCKRRSENQPSVELLQEQKELETALRVCTVSTRIERTISVELDHASQRVAEDEEASDGGWPVNGLPNAMPFTSPNVTCRSFASRPLTMLSFASTDEKHPQSNVPVRQRKEALRTLTATITADDDGSTSETASTASSHATSHTTATTTPPRHARTHKSTPASIHHSPSLNTTPTIPRTIAASLGSPTDWGANFWCVVTDPFSPANTFFANPTTGECRWVLPAGTMVLPPNPNGEWWELVDENTGREYYYHTRTEESRWTRPLSGMVIPMRAIQRAGHVAEKHESKAQWSSVRMDFSDRVERFRFEDKEEEEERLMTPLRPRTRSLPKPHARRKDATRSKTSFRVHRQMSEQLLTSAVGSRTSKPRQRYDVLEDLAQKARKSILLHDQKALENARRTCGPPFRPDPFNSQTQRRRPTTTHHSVSTAFSRITTTKNPASNETASPAITIQKLGKGLAFNPSTPYASPSCEVKERRSMSFLSRRASLRREGSRRGDVGRLPVDLTVRLLDVQVTNKAEEGRSAGVDVGGEEKKRKSKLATLLPDVPLWDCRQRGGGGNGISQQESVQNKSKLSNLITRLTPHRKSPLERPTNLINCLAPYRRSAVNDSTTTTTTTF